MSGAVRPFCRLLAIVIVLMPALAAAQGNRRTTLTTLGYPMTATTSTTTDFDAGSTTIGNTTFTVNLTTNSGAGGFSPRVTTVNVRCNTPCPAAGTAAATLQFRNVTTSGAWTSLTTAFQQIDSRTVAFGNVAQEPYTITVGWRYGLTWTGNPPAAATTFYIQYELVVTAP